MADPASDAAADQKRLHAAVRETRDDAAPFALAAGVILVLLGLLSLHAHWDLLGRQIWWVWLIVAAPYILLWATLLFGLGKILRSERRRELVIAILALVWAATFAGCRLARLLAGRPFGLAHQRTPAARQRGRRLAHRRRRLRARLLGARQRRPGRPRPCGDEADAGLRVPPGRQSGRGARRLGAAPLGLLLRLDHELDRVQPDRHEPAHEARQGPHGSRSRGSRRSSSSWSPPGRSTSSRRGGSGPV